MKWTLKGEILLLSLLAIFPSPLRSETQVVAWGQIYGSTPATPPGLTNIIALAAGYDHQLALRADGTVVAWGGLNSSGQRNVPPEATNVVRIAAGTSHCVALRGDGTVVFWGAINNQNNIVTAAPPETRANMMDIGLGFGADHVLQLRTDGIPVDWGNSNSTYKLPNIPANATNVIAIAAGGVHAIGLRSNGTIAAWGTSYAGTAMPPPASATNVVAIAAGNEFSVAVRSNGTLVAWGQNTAGQLTIPPSATNVARIACGIYNTVALRKDGPVLAWGPAGGFATVPVTLSNVVAVASGSYFAMALQSTAGLPLLGPAFAPPAYIGSSAIMRIEAVSLTPLTYQWTFYGTNLPAATNATLLLPDVQLAQAGQYSVIVSNAFGAVTNSDFALNIGPLLLTSVPQSQTALVGAHVKLTATAVGPALSFQWRFYGTNLPGMTTNSLSLTNVQLNHAGAYSVTVSNAYGGVVSPDAILTVVPSIVTTPLRGQSTFPGGDAAFNLGVQAILPITYQWKFGGTNIPGATLNSLAFTNVQPSRAGIYSVIFSNALEVQTHEAELIVTRIAGWGQSSAGQLFIPALTNVIAIASGGFYGLALKDDGTVTAWGINSSGQTNVPPNLTNVVAIAAGGYHSLALKSDGTVSAWGGNDYGQSDPPPDLNDVVAIAGGTRQSMALKADGTVATWGYTGAGLTNLPANLTNVVAIASGYAYDLVLKDDGRVVAWGANNTGQTNVPTGLTNAISITAGGFHASARTADGRVVTWGKYAGSGTPSIPSSVSNTVAIADGWESTMALTTDGRVTAWGRNSDNQIVVPSALSNVVAIAAGSYHNYALIGDGTSVSNLVCFNPVWSNHVFRASVASQSGRVYRLEYTDSPNLGNWTALPLVAGSGKIITLTDSTATNPQRYYRVRQW